MSFLDDIETKELKMPDNTPNDDEDFDFDFDDKDDYVEAELKKLSDNLGTSNNNEDFDDEDDEDSEDWDTWDDLEDEDDEAFSDSNNNNTPNDTTKIGKDFGMSFDPIPTLMPPPPLLPLSSSPFTDTNLKIENEVLKEKLKSKHKIKKLKKTVKELEETVNKLEGERDNYKKNYDKQFNEAVCLGQENKKLKEELNRKTKMNEHNNNNQQTSPPNFNRQTPPPNYNQQMPPNFNQPVHNMKNPTFVRDLVLSIVQFALFNKVTAVISFVLMMIADDSFKKGMFADYEEKTKYARIARIVGWVLGAIMWILMIAYFIFAVFLEFNGFANAWGG